MLYIIGISYIILGILRYYNLLKYYDNWVDRIYIKIWDSKPPTSKTIIFMGFTLIIINLILSNIFLKFG